MKKVIWLDFETTGLSESQCFPLEIGVLITDGELNEYAKYEEVIKRTDEELATMNDWCRENHTKSGLIDRVKQATKSQAEIEDELCALIQEHFPDPKDKPLLVGNSIHFDRGFIKVHFPKLDRLLHYRMIDLSGMCEALRIFWGVDTPRITTIAHRSMDDIRQVSIELLNRMKQRIQKIT